MAVPGFQEFMRPLLAFGLNGEVHVKEAIKKLAEQFGLSEDDQKAQLTAPK